MDTSLLIALPLLLYVVLSGLSAMLKARKRSWVMAVVRLIITVAAAVAALPLTTYCVEMGADFAYDEVLIPALDKDLVAFFTEVPVGAEGLRVLAGLILAPIVYIVIFVLLRWALNILAWIVEKCVPALRRRTRLYFALPLGALTGIIVSVVILIPVCGYAMLGTNMFHTFMGTELGQDIVSGGALESVGLTEEDLNGIVSDAENNVVMTTVYQTVGKPVFRALTTDELNTSVTHGKTVEINLESELCGLLKTAGYAVEVLESFDKEDYTAEDKELLFVTADTFFTSDWVRMLAADTLAAMAGDWLEDEDFAGIDRPELDVNLDPTFNLILELLATETADTLEKDIHDILDVVGDLLVYDLLGSDADYADMVQSMGKSGLLSQMLAKLEANERMAPLAAELKNLGVRLVSNMLGIDQLKNGEYAEMMGNVAGTLTESLSMSQEERDAMVLESIKNNFGDQGFDVPDDVALQMANKMIDELGADGEITGDELTQYMIRNVDEGFEYIPEDIPDNIPGLTE